MEPKIRVTVWNEFLAERRNPEVGKVYPEGIHGAIAGYLREREGLEVKTATFEEPEHGLTGEVLGRTDVLIWWGHLAHSEVKDQVVEAVKRRIVEEGMGLIVLHSGHMSKIFRSLMGTTCTLKWREAGERERVWVVSPSHPIARGIEDHFDIDRSEMYGEPFDVPEPDELVFISWFKGGEVFRSGCCFRRGLGKIFYFSPGHETYPIYRDRNVLRVIENAVRWAAPGWVTKPLRGNVRPLERLE
jgi:trehalose utilization protein